VNGSFRKIDISSFRKNFHESVSDISIVLMINNLNWTKKSLLLSMIVACFFFEIIVMSVRMNVHM